MQTIFCHEFISAALIYKHTSVWVHYKDHCSIIHNYIYIKILYIYICMARLFRKSFDKRERHKRCVYACL